MHETIHLINDIFPKYGTVWSFLCEELFFPLQIGNHLYLFFRAARYLADCDIDHDCKTAISLEALNTTSWDPFANWY